MSTFPERLRAHRARAGLSQGKLARLIGVETNTVWRYEAGKLKPRMDLLPLIAGALGVSVDDLIGGEQLHPPTRADRQARLEQAAEEVISTRDLSEREIQILRSLRDLGEIEVDADLLWEIIRALRARTPAE